MKFDQPYFDSIEQAGAADRGDPRGIKLEITEITVTPISGPLVKSADFLWQRELPIYSLIASSYRVCIASVSSVDGCVRIADPARHPSGSSFCVSRIRSASRCRARSDNSPAPLEVKCLTIRNPGLQYPRAVGVE
ncbi:hypothetical protein FXV83_27460 [Bradyrhizobium hipponense]|uniref:Uncharacterized protein n=1 Tax=Bradyrhizobium hipponense TaxID=2605638 RepID=A0A5S4YJ90_9BRAD|nr:hypothetical protein [Bradyrhizobium hipponense]TYO63395.1 hypothetical protein FXV83_27460 [Bradyrhizobium hipponense]